MNAIDVNIIMSCRAFEKEKQNTPNSHVYRLTFHA